MSAPVDVLAVMDENAEKLCNCGTCAKSRRRRELTEARAAVADLMGASANLRKWTGAVVDHYSGAWRLRDEDAEYTYFPGGCQGPECYEGDFLHGTPGGEFYGEHEAKLELNRQRSFAIARMDAAIARCKGETA